MAGADGQGLAYRSVIAAALMLMVISLPTAAPADTAEAKPAAASSSSAGGGGAPSRQTCRSDLVELSDVSARPALHSAPEEQPKTILVVGLGGGVLCNRGTLDWRADLPRYLGAYANATVIVYYRSGSSTCRYCWRNDDPHGPDSPDRPREKGPTCEQRIQEGVDLVMFVGSGKVYRGSSCRGYATPDCADKYHDLYRLMSRPWAQAAKKIVHFPIRALPQLTENKVFNFDTIIDDNSFAKPVSSCAVSMLRSCDAARKRNELLYIGRFAPHKGQMAFLQKVNPKLLQGYKLRMFGKPDNTTYLRELKSFAASRDIDMSVNTAVSKSRLFRNLCQAKGLIIVSEDKNPRAVYEAATSGLPVLVAREAQVAEELRGQPWFVETSTTRPTMFFNDDVSTFMQALSADNVTHTIRGWIDDNLSSKAIYLGLCQRMGACQPDDSHWFESAKDPTRERWRRTRQLGNARASTGKRQGPARWNAWVPGRRSGMARRPSGRLTRMSVRVARTARARQMPPRT